MNVFVDSPKKKRILISGHRGTRVHAIENTKKAFEYCLDNKIDYVEFDVRYTKDQELVIFHDQKVDRLLNGFGDIEQMTLIELKKLTYRDGQQILTLSELFEITGKRIRLMLEIKSRGIAHDLIHLAHKYGYQNNELLIQSLFPTEIIACQQLDPQYDYCLCTRYLGKTYIFSKMMARFWFNKIARPFPIKWLNLDGPFIYDAFISETQEYGIHIILGSMQTERFLPQLKRWGIEIVNADDPVKIRNIIHDLGNL
jgi:glycerophosphoryl diester phosphodiesterase